MRLKPDLKHQPNQLMCFLGTKKYGIAIGSW
jgi:hypothetical protein